MLCAEARAGQQSSAAEQPAAMNESDLQLARAIVDLEPAGQPKKTQLSRMQDKQQTLR